jgi:dipeptidyl aminopeptidase/acylaminoacyl peptidase
LTPTTFRRASLRAAQAAALTLLAAALAPARSDTPAAPPQKANYKLAKKFGKASLAPLTYSEQVTPSWIGKTDVFWYSYRTSAGTRFWKVDPAKKTKDPLFNHEKLGGLLAELSRKPVDANQLPLTRGQINSAGTKFSFVAMEMLYEYDLKDEKLVSKGKAPAPRPGEGVPPFGDKGRGKGKRGADDEAQEKEQKKDDKEVEREEEKKDDKDMDDTDKSKGPPTGPTGRTTRAVSPDKKSVLLSKNHNLYLAEAGKEKDAVPLTKDGGEDYGFYISQGFGMGGGRGRGGFGPPGGAGPTLQRGTWAKDSNHFYAYRQDKRGVKELFVINSLANPRPTLEKYPYPMPGEDAIRKTELHVGSREARALRRVAPKWRDESYSDVHWGKEPNELRFIRRDRLLRNLELCSLNVDTGECKALISEGFENANVEYQTPRYLEDSNEMVWWSEKTGWAHFYLYDRDGKPKNAITSGQFRASRIVHLDEKERRLWFLGNAREKGENVYYQHLYSVKLDGSDLKLLDPGDATHQSFLSPTRKFVVDNASRIDRAPESCLRDATGAKVMDLEKADLSRLQEYGWKLPETFSVKAADGVTDLFGNLWKPFDFDPNRKYPIIAYVYPGPQQEGLTHTFAASGSYMQLAQLGFIVIQVGHRGGAPTRSKAYASYGYFNLRDYGLADKKAAIEQLAARHGWIDITKVGIFGHSGGGFMSAAALLQKPYNEFFKAAVASAGNHDNNIYNNSWSERYHGLKEIPLKEEAKEKDKAKLAAGEKDKDDKATPAAPPPPKTALPKSKFEIKVPTNAELAANLKGRLLLVHGELDNNVHPANTMRLVDALIKANKRFDMLMLPATRHGFGTYQPYFQQRMWEFFAEHLLGDRRTGADLTEE